MNKNMNNFLELPQKCYILLLLFGYENTEYAVTSIKYSYKNGIEEVTAEKPREKIMFGKEDIGKTVFFTKEEAVQKMKELEKRKLKAKY